MVLDIVLIILGIVILIASILLYDTGNSKNTDSFFDENQIKDIDKKIDTVVKNKLEKLSQKSDDTITKADDAMDKISNEKMMALDEFSNINLAKIQENHDHVVFLYNMLTSKDDEVKLTLSDLENAKQELKETMTEVIKITRQLNAAVRKNAKNSESISGNSSPLTASSAISVNTSTKIPDKPKSKSVPVKVPKDTENFKKSSQEILDEENGQLNMPLMMQSDNKNDEILRMHKEGKSILEISKLLSKGQGEVKLVIDLYGNK